MLSRLKQLLTQNLKCRKQNTKHVSDEYKKLQIYLNLRNLCENTEIFMQQLNKVLKFQK